MPIPPSKLTPRHLAALRLYALGHTQIEVCRIMGVSTAYMQNLLSHPQAQDTLRSLQDNTIDTIANIQTSLQAVAPALLEEKVRLAFTAKSEEVRSKSCKELLEMSGHSAVRHVEIRRGEASSQWDNKDDDAIRKALIEDLTPDDKQTVH